MSRRRSMSRPLVAVVLGLVTALIVHAQLVEAGRWGATRRVPVLTRALGAGEVIEGGHVRFTDVPRSVTPDAPVAPDPVGRAALVPLMAGEVLLQHRVAPGAGLAGLVPPGRRAVAVPQSSATPPVSVGDQVDVVGGDPPGTLAAAAPVVGVDEEATIVAVAARDAPELAAGVLAGEVSLVLVAPGGIG